MFHRILAVTDGSVHADCAVRLAAEIAAAQRAQLTVATVLQLSVLEGATLERLQRAFPEEAGRARRVLDGATVPVPLDVPVTTLTIWGTTIVAAIIAEIDKGGYDLLVIGSRGRGTVRSALLGSVSQGVVGRSPIPVLVARSDQTPVAGPPTVRRILVAIEGRSTQDGAILGHAVDLAATEGAALTLMTVCSVPTGSGPAVAGLIEDEAMDAGELLDDARAGIPDDVAVDELVDWGAPADCILEALANRGHDLVVLGSHGRGPMSSALLGSVGRALVQRAAVPVLVVRSRRT